MSGKREPLRLDALDTTNGYTTGKRTCRVCRRERTVAIAIEMFGDEVIGECAACCGRAECEAGCPRCRPDREAL